MFCVFTGHHSLTWLGCPRSISTHSSVSPIESTAYGRRSSQMLHQLLRGAPVEHGTHMAELEELHKGSVRTAGLVLR